MKKTKFTEFVRCMDSRVLVLENSNDFSYSDGDQTELKILDIVRRSNNVDMFSPELIQEIHDWPSEYHFSPRRSNLIRILENIGPGTRVLELGCGCGAITKAFAEKGCEVDAVEGSLRRASVAAERVRQHQGVNVYCANFQDVEFEPVYDVVTLIGVLEYSPVYIDSEDPFVACLEMAASAVKRDGVLLVAIENKVGLKYFSGISEDHFSVPYYGIEGRYGPREITTYGKRQLAERLQRAGLSNLEFFYPFPDYKLPEVVLSERGVQHAKFNPTDLVAGLENRDYSKIGKQEFRIDLVWKSIAEEGLLGELSNSFLVLAGGRGVQDFFSASVLAQKYTDTRRPFFNCVTSFHDENDRILVRKTKLLENFPEVCSPLTHLLSEENYAEGENVVVRMRRVLSCDRRNEFVELLKAWIDYVTRNSESGVLPNSWFDAHPSNLVIDMHGRISYIDREWGFNGVLDCAFVICRGFLSLASDPFISPHIQGEGEDDKVVSLSREAGFSLDTSVYQNAKNFNHELWQAISDEGRFVADRYRYAKAADLSRDSSSKKEKGEALGSVRMIAFHLPQFHEILENNEWWGAGFTEWDNVRQGRPLFDGHYQPHQPGELGYYDLSDVSVLEKQARLARQFGLEGFCFYYYWFDGKRLLEKPVDQLLAHPEINLPFCLCWANENWTRRWDGGEHEVLMRQSYSEEHNSRFAEDLLPYFRDPRYIRISEKPVLLVYRADIIPNLYEVVATWRKVWHAHGIGDVFLVCVESFTVQQPRAIGFDAACEFFPHQVNFSKLLPAARLNNLVDERAQIGDYNKLAKSIESRPKPPYKRFRGLVPSWDNSSRRRKGGATFFVDATPERYEKWLEYTVKQTMIEQEGDERLVFINAWNEWGEGCHLEPDVRFGRAWLEATLRAKQSASRVDVHYFRHVQPYQLWLAAQQIDEISAKRLVGELNHPVRFTVVIDAVASSAEQLSETLKSFSRQQYANIQLLVVSPMPAPAGLGQFVLWFQAEIFPEILLTELARPIPDSWFCLIQAGDQIAESGLLLLAGGLAGSEASGLVYGDEDVLDAGYGPSRPIFRRDFDIDHLRSYPYLGRLLLFRGKEYLELGGFDWSSGPAKYYDYALRFYESFGEKGIFHQPSILFHASQRRDEGDIQSAHRVALHAHLLRCNVAAEVDAGGMPGSFRVRYPYEAQPLVSIIIPTKNQLSMLQRCLESLLEKTAYKNYEILLVDNQSSDVATVDYLNGLVGLNLPNLQVLSYQHEFNFADMNNLAVREARGEYLVLLNNDTAIVKSDWLDALLNHARRPEVGIVGAKLLYPDGTVQHAGVVLGLRGPADHPFVGEAMASQGYGGRLLLDQQYSAVTAACMMVRKSVYDAVGGMDAEAFKVSYNDVDFCLRVREAGFRIVWTPYAVVMHEGNVSQKQVDTATQESKQQRFRAEQNMMYRRWLSALVSDPSYNPNLSLVGNGFTLEADPLFNRYSGLFLPKVVAHNADPYGSGNYRVIQPLQALLAADLACGGHRDYFLDPVPLAKVAPDVIVLQKQFTDGQLVRLSEYREFSGAKLVYELDDYLPNLPTSSVHKDGIPKDMLRRMRQAMACCDRVVVSTDALKSSLGDIHSDIVVLPNYLPSPWWGNIAAHPEVEGQRKPRVGWAGGISHAGDLRLIIDVVKALADRIDWVFFGMLPKGLETTVAEYHPGVSVEDYPDRLAALGLDLALAPLEDNLFNRCKSNLRLLEYGICGFPVVATDIEPYRCGLPVTLVRNRFKDWKNAIEEKLAEPQALRAEGLALQATVKKEWMLEGDNLMRWRDGWMLAVGR